MKSACFKILLFLLPLPILTGCSSIQVRDRTYVQALELHHAASPQVSLHDFSHETEIASGNGNTIDEALTNAGIATGKELFLGHLELLTYANPAFTVQLDDLMHDYRLSPSCQVVGLSENASFSDTDTTAFTNQLRQEMQQGKLPETNLFTILREMDGSAETAFFPIWTEEGFSGAVGTVTSWTTLSADASAGLCWLRGDNFPEKIAENQDTVFSVQSARTQFSVQMQDEIPLVTIKIRITGQGDFSSAAAVIEGQCESALEETLRASGADVIDLEEILWSQCYSYMAQTDWRTAAKSVQFCFQIKQK